MLVATTETLGMIVGSDGEVKQITATLEIVDYNPKWILRCGGEDAQTGQHDTLEECLNSGVASWMEGDWQFETTAAGTSVLGW
jgi:hypothetical protein